MDIDRIEKRVTIAADVSRVWRAVTDYREFGAWFRVDLKAPFVVGQETYGSVTYPGFEHLTMRVIVEEIEPERRFSFKWHPYAIDPSVEYGHEPPTLVEFTLESLPEGTRLTVSESGFAALPAHRRDEAFRMNDGGWATQMQNISAYVSEGAARGA